MLPCVYTRLDSCLQNEGMPLKYSRELTSADWIPWLRYILACAAGTGGGAGVRCSEWVMGWYGSYSFCSKNLCNSSISFKIDEVILIVCGKSRSNLQDWLDFRIVLALLLSNSCKCKSGTYNGFATFSLVNHLMSLMTRRKNSATR